MVLSDGDLIVYDFTQDATTGHGYVAYLRSLGRR